MYGLILENFAMYIRRSHGEETWENIRKLANINNSTFSTHQVYPDSMVGKLSKKATLMLGMTEEELFENIGHYFVEFVGSFGYGDVLALLGRQLTDFLNGLDNLHEYIKFSYPRIRAPSYFCCEETEKGLILLYRSKRKGLSHYTIGQLKSVAEKLYQLDLKIEVLKEEVVADASQVSFKLEFDNRPMDKRMTALIREEARLPAVSSALLYDIFPFLIIFGEDMVTQTIGRSLMQIMPELAGNKIKDFFELVRPMIEFNFRSILLVTNNIFEILAIDRESDENIEDNIHAERHNQLCLKGQMMFMPDWNVIMFLGCPFVTDLDELTTANLYINDLPIHDFSRDILLSSSEHSDNLKKNLEEEIEKTKLLEVSMKEIDEERKRSDELLAQMIPNAVAEQVKAGINPTNTCEYFECVTIVFNNVHGFSDICAKCDGMEIVALLNNLFGMFDHLSDKHSVYKVETVKDCFVGVSGAPERVDDHAERIANMLLDMRDSAEFLLDPRPEYKDTKEHIKIGLGAHSGNVVAGIIGNKCPRYCLFGDAMNTSSRMMSSGEEQKIHISKNLKDKLSSDFITKERGVIKVKGKGDMTTYWLESKVGRDPLKRSEVLLE